MKYNLILVVIVSLLLTIGCGDGGSAIVPTDPPVDNSKEILVSPQFVGPHAAQALKAFERAAQNNTGISVGVDLRNADNTNGYRVHERTEHRITSDGLITITNLHPGPLSMWLSGDFDTQYHWAGAADLEFGHNVIYLSTHDDNMTSEQYREYNTMNRVFDDDRANLFAEVAYPRFQAICRESSSTGDAYSEVLDEAGIQDHATVNVQLNFDGEPYAANSNGCHNQDSTYGPGDYLEHVIKYNVDGNDTAVIAFDWCVVDEDGNIVDCGYSEEVVGPGSIDNGVYVDVGSTDYGEGDYDIEYDVTATNEDGLILDHEDATVILSLDLNQFNRIG